MAVCEMVRLVILGRREHIELVSFSFVGVVSPSRFKTVPKCLEYVAVSLMMCDSSELRVLVFIVASTGHWRSKFHAKLVNGSRCVSVGVLCMLTWHLLLFRPSFTTKDRSPALSM